MMKEETKKLRLTSKLLKPLAAEMALGEVTTLKEPRVLQNWLLWLEQRPAESGRTTALIRPWGRSDLPAQELTPAPINIRSRVHSYGGAPLATSCDGDCLLITWIDDSDGCLWVQSWQGLSCRTIDQKTWFESSQLPKRLSCKGDYALADGFIDSFESRWIGVMERDGKDFLVSFDLNQVGQAPRVIYRPQDFAGYAALSPDGTQLAWVEWQYPSMPWDASQLWWGRFDKSGAIAEKKLLAGNSSPTVKETSVFQPIWLSSGELLVSEDSSGWWNLMMLDNKMDFDDPMWNRIWPMEAETAMPQWVYGMSTTTSDGKQIVSACCHKGHWRINLLSFDGLISEFDQPFDDLTGLHADNNRVVAIASNSLKEPGLLEIDLSVGSWSHSSARDPLLKEDQISVPESFWFEGFRGELTHGWYYPPAYSNGDTAPLLLKTHSGPTGMASSGLNLGIQFWTSRGWAVADVNYGGSTGFGRAYRERLKGGWGQVDVFDCSAAAKFLIASGKANSEYIAIEGGSAGGFTTLACLCFTDVFRVGACRYAVSDLQSMVEDTHRFEAGYLDHLLGSWSVARQKYLDRSPLNHVEQITAPVIFFQGLKDKVVLPDQTERIAAVLRKQNIPVEVLTFPDEGHGFRDGRVRVQVLELTEKFFRKHLGL